jgi:outer membrane immunogenic protein
MRQFILAAVAAAALAGSVQAADMPVKAPRTVAAVVANWTGLTISASAGAAHYDYDWALTNPLPATIVPFSMSNTSFVFGVHVGAQYQVGSFVFGIEGGVTPFRSEYARNVGCGPNPTLATLTCSVRTNAIFMVGGKAGYAFDRWMIYGAGGGAWARLHSTFIDQNPAIFSDTGSSNHSGWYAGGGLDYMLLTYPAFDIIAGVEYRHIDLRRRQHTSSADGFDPAGANARNISADIDIVWARLTLKANPFR